MTKRRLDGELVRKQLATTRLQAENLIRKGKVHVDGRAVTKPGYFVRSTSSITMATQQQYVGRAGLKLASVADILKLNFVDKIVLDVGSSTGGFTDYALQNGAKKIYAVEVGTKQLHPKLKINSRIELHEKTDIREFRLAKNKRPDIIMIDVSFISVREILPYIAAQLTHSNTRVVAMVKPQFEASSWHVNKGVIKNDSVRRKILKDFERWARERYVIIDKRDSDVAGGKGNQERFYVLQKLK